MKPDWLCLPEGAKEESPKHSELSQLRTSRMRIEESHRLGCVQVLEKMSQLDFEKFQILCQNLCSRGDGKGQVGPGPSREPK